MKYFFKSICAAFILTVIFSMIPFNARCDNLSDEVFRLHILANSDSEQDQALKLKVRDRILKYTEKLFLSSKSLREAESLTSSQLGNIAETAATEIKKQGYNYPVKAEISKISFDTRYYGKVTMPAGNYDALRITIGAGRGHNWWCVMYPSLCVGASSRYDELRRNTSADEYSMMTEDGFDVRFKIIEIFNNLRNIFS